MGSWEQKRKKEEMLRGGGVRPSGRLQRLKRGQVEVTWKEPMPGVFLKEVRGSEGDVSRYRVQERERLKKLRASKQEQMVVELRSSLWKHMRNRQAAEEEVLKGILSSIHPRQEVLPADLTRLLEEGRDQVSMIEARVRARMQEAENGGNAKGTDAGG